MYCQTCLEIINGPLNENAFFCECENESNEYYHFLFMNVFDQISYLVKKHFKTIEKFLNNPKDYLDLTDGEYYSFIKKPNTLHVVIYSDGTPIRKSTKKNSFGQSFLVSLNCLLPLESRLKIKSYVVFGTVKENQALTFYLILLQTSLVNIIPLQCDD